MSVAVDRQMDLMLAVLFEKVVVVFEKVVVVVVVTGQGLHQMDSMLAVVEKVVVVDSLLHLQTDWSLPMQIQW